MKAVTSILARCHNHGE